MRLAVLMVSVTIALLAGGFYTKVDVLSFCLIIGSILPQAYFCTSLSSHKATGVFIGYTILIYAVLASRFAPIHGVCGVIYAGIYALFYNHYKAAIKDLVFRKTKIRQALSREYQNLIEKYDRVKDLDLELKQKSVEIVDMYEIAKKMSLSIRLSGILQILHQYLNENFQFKEFSIIFVNQIGDRYTIDRVFRISQESDQNAAKGNLFKLDGKKDSFMHNQADEEILRLCSKTKEPVFESLDSRKGVAGGILEGKKIQSLFAVPAILGDSLRYIFCIENVRRGQCRKFQILTDQCVLELEKVKLYEQVEKLAITDSLTGLYVKRHFMDLAEGEVGRIIEHKLSLACLMLDMDLFKECNDTYGHLMGDVVLKNSADIIKKNTREVDIVTRYGGEEFLMLLPETDLEGACNVAERIRQGVETFEFRAFNQTARSTISIGIAVYPDGGEGLDQLIENSDRALYQAKMQGRNRVCVYQPDKETSEHG